MLWTLLLRLCTLKFPVTEGDGTNALQGTAESQYS
jgi:hypothetical protein